MTSTEFKAWFSGFTEAMLGTPNKAQWARIKAKVEEIDGNSTPSTIFIEKYWPSYRSSPTIFDDRTTWKTDLSCVSSSGNLGVGNIETLQRGTQIWNSTEAFKSLGLEDFRVVQ